MNTRLKDLVGAADLACQINHHTRAMRDFGEQAEHYADLARDFREAGAWEKAARADAKRVAANAGYSTHRCLRENFLVQAADEESVRCAL